MSTLLRRCATRLAAAVVPLCLLSLPASGQDAGTDPPGWKRLASCRKPEGNVNFAYDWQSGEGVSMMVRRRSDGAAATLVLDAEGLDATVATAATTAAARTRTLLNAPPNDTAETIVTLKIRTTEWALYLDNRLAATMPAPFTLPGDVFISDRDAAHVRSQPHFLAVPKEWFVSDFMIEEGAPNQLYPWQPQSGQWRIHTAMDDAQTRPESNLERMKTVPLTADKSPNFYSLKGVGENAIITTGYDFYDDYEFAAAMQVNAGEAGLVFYHRDADNYYSFTIDLLDGKQGYGILRLTRVRDGEHTILAQARADLFRDQWYMPRIRAHTDEIVCLLDRSLVFTIREPLPVGGKVGLFANRNEEIRFDDVYLSSYERLPLRNAGEIRYEALVADESFFRAEGFLGGEIADTAKELRVADEDEAQSLIVGRPHHEGVFFGAQFLPADGDGEFGVVAGYQSASESFLRCVVRREGEQETFRLERVTGEETEVLDSWTRDMIGTAEPRLAVDATEEGWLRFLEDDKLVILHPVEGKLLGAAGVWIGPRATVSVRDLRYDFRRERYKERLQENKVFAEDSFMRNWSSPEGQWIARTKDMVWKEGEPLWHKGDFFSDFSITMPCVPNGELHVGVPDGAASGPVVVSVAPPKLTLRISLPDREPEVYETELTPAAGEQIEAMKYTLHHEGYWVWITIGDKRVLRHRLDEPLPGRQALVKGISPAQLAHSLVTRINVIDDFFSESPHNWLINGGKWQIINRFQCTPSWSHMIGESADTMAALWYKAVFEGDLTLEFYAGTRHGWYERMGDLNCTVMAKTTTPSSGYTVTCTGWNEELSQKWSTVRRNGVVMDRSDAYLVPRRRAGLVRKFLNPLLSEGRPYHGAWYYIKLRKVGNKLEYYFDNEKIFEETDPEMIRQGMLGIWTFMHSMTVAQVKITFQEIAFPDLPLAPMPNATAPTRPPVPTDVALDGFPLQALGTPLWSTDDTVGHAVARTLPGRAPGLAVVNRLGSGDMLAKPNLPPVELRKLAGWQFLLKRTPDAQINVHYSIGTMDANGQYAPQTQCVHRISGDSFDGTALVETGRTAVPGSSATDLATGWATVQVWIPEELRSASDTDGKQKVRFEGIGTIGESGILCGLTGNGPGAAYYVRQFSPIQYDTPRLSVGETPVLFILREGQHEPEIARSEDPDVINQSLAERTVPGLNTAWLRVKYGDGDGYSRKLLWASCADSIPWKVVWDEHEPGAVVLRRQGDLPDPRLAGATIALADGTALPTEASPGQLVARLPRSATASVTSEPLQLKVTVAGKTVPVSLDWRDRPIDDRPVLLGVEGLPGFCASFEKGVGRLSHTGDARQTMQYGDPEQGRYLQVRNTALAQRLHATFGTDFAVSSYPVLGFRYRAYDMTYTSLAFSNSHYVRLSQDLASAVKVRYADEDLVADGGWHSWQGMVSDAFTQAPFLATRFHPSYARFGSAHAVDQTGRYTKMDLDDMVFGPAVADAKQLAFTPEFFDADGVESVSAAISPEPTPFSLLTSEQRAALSWAPHPPGQQIVPDLNGLADGLHHLLYKATDRNGRESEVMDIPFLADRTPLTVSSAFAATAVSESNGLHAVITMDNQGGSPWAIGKASFLVGDKKRTIYAWSNSYLHSATADRAILNYPLIMRSQLDNAADGQTVTMKLTNIQDGAGNASPDLAIPYTISYAKDKTGPSWYWLKFGTSVHSFYNWDGSFDGSVAFSPGSYNQTSVVNRPGGSSYLQNLTYRQNGDLSRTVNWKPATHPWLSCRVQVPKYRKGLRLIVTLATNRGSYTISTMAPGGGRRELGRGLNIPWAAGKWMPISVNVAEALRGTGLNDAQLSGVVVSTITISQRGFSNREAIYLDDFYLHGTPGKSAAENRMTWYAYDCSGVASLEMACLAPNGSVQWTHDETGRTANLHELAKRVKGAQWFRCRAKDKAGNVSGPFYLPIAGN